MKGKRGIALSLMILIGIVFLIIMFFAFAMRGQMVGLIKPKVADISAVQIYVENCVDAVSQYAVYKIGKQGGSIQLDEPYFASPFLDVNYGFNKGKTFPAIDEAKLEIENFVNENLKNCTAGFRGFGSQGISVKEGDVRTDVFFGLRSTIVTVSYPLEITYQDKTFALDKFQRDIPVGLKKIHSKTDEFLNLDRYNLTYLRGINSNIYIVPFENDDLIVQESLDSRIYGENYLFLTAIAQNS